MPVGVFTLIGSELVNALTEYSLPLTYCCLPQFEVEVRHQGMSGYRTGLQHLSLYLSSIFLRDSFSDTINTFFTLRGRFLPL